MFSFESPSNGSPDSQFDPTCGIPDGHLSVRSREVHPDVTENLEVGPRFDKFNVSLMSVADSVHVGTVVSQIVVMTSEDDINVRITLLSKVKVFLLTHVCQRGT